MWNKTLKKDRFSEWVIRNSLYWMTPYTSWKLVDNISNWVVYFEVNNSECEYEFERLLNDYSLREKLQNQTGYLRDTIIRKVLHSIDERLS